MLLYPIFLQCRGKKGVFMLSQKHSACILAAVLLLASASGCSVKTDNTASADPLTITVWTYYNGDQLELFNKLVSEFNDTTGRSLGIIVESSSQGTVNDLETNVLASANGEVGASDMPNIFSAYADTAYTLDQMGLVMDLSDYLTKEERLAYIDNYLDEGDFSGDGNIKIFPVAKSTELLFLNDTDWRAFSDATGASYEDLSTIEGLVSTAEMYYNWTDEQTPEKNDGRALFGRDAMANYLLLGAKQLGSPIFNTENGKMSLNFDKEVMRKLWDNYYVPYVKGYFSASGRFRSDDIKTGNIIGYVGSTSSATFFPTQVSLTDSESYDITLKVLPCPKFADGENYVVQQGTGLVVTKTEDDATVKACVEFLKWFTAPEHNISFCAGSGYLPVTKEANNMDTIRKSTASLSASMDSILTVAVDSVNSNQMYTTKAFNRGNDARQILSYGLSDLAAADRQTVEERLSGGQSLEDAATEFLTDDYFEAWYQDTLKQLQAFEG